MKLVYTAQDLITASLAKDFLVGSGVHAVIKNDSLLAMRGALPLTTDAAPSVWVEEDDFARAKKLISDWEQSLNQDSQPWTCAACGEGNDGPFMSCWNCRGDRR
jgi:hypothetical protein